MVPFLENCWEITLKLAPWLLLGAGVAGVLHIFLPTGWLNRQLRGPWGVVKSVVLGVPLPLCSCGVIPVGLGLRKGGASSGASVGFLISTPQTGVDSILVSGMMLGWPFALFKVAAAAVTGVVGGWTADAVEKPTQMLPVIDGHLEKPPERTFGEWLSYSDTMLHSLWRWLVVGVLVSALITTFLPPAILGGLAGHGALAAMGLTLLVSLPLYVCATASVPIAASLVASGLPTGAALVFLMAGPATNVATIGAVRKALGTRSLLVYLAVIIVGSVAAGLLFEAVLPNQTAAPHDHQHGEAWWEKACAIALLLLVARYAIVESVGYFRRTPDVETALSVAVQGMTCDGCVAKLEKTLRKSPNIRHVRVTLHPGEATVDGSVSLEELRQLVRDAGFTPQA